MKIDLNPSAQAMLRDVLQHMNDDQLTPFTESDAVALLVRQRHQQLYPEQHSTETQEDEARRSSAGLAKALKTKLRHTGEK